jgi:hypothetical protein
MRNLRTFRNLCGPDAMPNVVIATTMRGEVEENVGEQREQELKRYFWNQMVADARQSVSVTRMSPHGALSGT